MADTSAQVTVLLVEDHPDVAEVTLLMLDSMGAQADHAASVAEATSLCAQKAYDLLLTDMRLPDGTGMDVIRTVCTQGRPRAVVLTAYGAGEPLPSEPGTPIERMTKPVEMNRLQEVIHQLVLAKQDASKA